jgi:hypothetical protein
MISFEEGVNCFTQQHTVDRRDMGNTVVLKGGQDAAGDNLVAVMHDEEAAGKYGSRIKVISESQWTTQVLCELRALQLLQNFKMPEERITIEATSEEIVSVGEEVSYTSTTLDIDGVFQVVSVTYDYSEDTDLVIVELSSRTADLAEFLVSIMRNLERR